MRTTWPPLYTLPSHYYYIRRPYAHYPRVEISRINRFRAYLGCSVRGRPSRDLPSRAPIIELQKFAIAREVAGEVAGGAV